HECAHTQRHTHTHTHTLTHRQTHTHTHTHTYTNEYTHTHTHTHTHTPSCLSGTDWQCWGSLLQVTVMINTLPGYTNRPSSAALPAAYVYTNLCAYITGVGSYLT